MKLVRKKEKNSSIYCYVYNMPSEKQDRKSAFSVFANHKIIILLMHLR